MMEIMGSSSMELPVPQEEINFPLMESPSPPFPATRV